MAEGANQQPEEDEPWNAPHDRNLFLAAVVSSATVCAMIVFIAIKGRGRSGYPIFKEKSVGLTIVHMVAGLIWTWASMVVEEHLKPSWLGWVRGSDFSLCVFWAHWSQVCLGWGLWMACSFTRNYRLYKRDVKREEPVGFVIHLCVFNFPWFLIVLVDQILFNTRYEDGENPFALKKDHCMYSEVPWEVHSLYLYMMFCLFLFISMRGRGYGNRFNDYYQINLCMILAALVWLVILFQIFTDTNFTPNGRLVKTTLVSPSARPLRTCARGYARSLTRRRLAGVSLDPLAHDLAFRAHQHRADLQMCDRQHGLPG